MPNSQGFDYDQPTRETLTGISVEAQDQAREEVPPVLADPAQQTQPSLEELFGHTLTVEDGRAAEQSNAHPPARRSGSPG